MSYFHKFDPGIEFFGTLAAEETSDAQSRFIDSHSCHVEAGRGRPPGQRVSREPGISDVTYSVWNSKYSGWKPLTCSARATGGRAQQAQPRLPNLRWKTMLGRMSLQKKLYT